MLLRIVLIFSAIFLLTPNAEARHYHRHHHAVRHHHIAHRHHIIAENQQTFQPFGFFGTVTNTIKTAVRAQFLPHPSGCPHTQFCGCGASIEVYGHPVRSLYLAANWYKFPRTSPAPGMAAVRPHHVFVLKEHVSGDTWIVFDANSGGHLTRLHARSISGYTIVNPR
jgi:hypothetical protein